MSDFVSGVRYFGQGFGILARRPKLLLVGMLPAVLTAAILLTLHLDLSRSPFTDAASASAAGPR